MGWLAGRQEGRRGEVVHQDAEEGRRGGRSPEVEVREQRGRPRPRPAERPQRDSETEQPDEHGQAQDALGDVGCGAAAGRLTADVSQWVAGVPG